MNGRTPEGDRHGYVGELIDEDWSPEPKPAEPVMPPRLECQPDFPEPGIYFGMPEEVYHSIHALSTSGIKHYSVSSMNYWAKSLLNPDRQERQSRFFNYGKAVHCLVLEGEAEYLRRYAVELSLEEQPEGVLVSTDEIEAAIGQFNEMATAQPVGNTKQELLDQLIALADANGCNVERDGTVPQLKERIRSFEIEQPVKPVSRVKDETSDGTEFQRPATKQDWIDQLLALQPDALIWDDMLAKHAKEHEGADMISAADDRRIRISAHMIDRHEQIGPLLRSGYPEASIFWHCRATGAPMKARLDWLKLNAIIDLKTFSNVQEMPVDRAIEKTIANYGYNIQHVIYDEAVIEARRMIRAASENDGRIGDVIHVQNTTPEAEPAIFEFCQKWCAIEEPPQFLFIFQQSGIAPVTRGKRMPRGLVFSVTKARCEMIKRQWIERARVFGTDPWLDHAPIEDIDEERLPQWATEIGKSEDE